MEDQVEDDCGYSFWELEVTSESGRGALNKKENWMRV